MLMVKVFWLFLKPVAKLDCCDSFVSLLVFSTPLCYCTAELLSSCGRPSSVRPSPFSENPSDILMPNLVERYLFTISPDHFLFFKMLHFLFFTIFFLFINMGPYGRKTSKRHLIWKYITDSLQKIYAKGLYQSCIKIGRISHFGFLPLFWDIYRMLHDYFIYYITGNVTKAKGDCFALNCTYVCATDKSVQVALTDIVFIFL